MNKKTIKSVILIILLYQASCNDPETVVTNIVNPDGSVTRKIEMRSAENKFDVSVIKVPFDNTWTIRDSIEIGRDGDTTWVKRAEKIFSSVDEINLSYDSDSGPNGEFRRSAEFRKQFRWFSTVYRFAESVGKLTENENPVSDYLSPEELRLFYSPDWLIEAQKKSADSLIVKAMLDSIEKKSSDWIINILVSEWIGDFSRLTEGKAGTGIGMSDLKVRKDELVTVIKKYENSFDSLWENGTILKEMIGESNASSFKAEADSAVNISLEKLFPDFRNYTVRIAMPGKLIETNGFVDRSMVLVWPVKSDFFVAEDYRMWAESRMTNWWAWIVSGLFLAFVVTGLVLRMKSEPGV